MNETKSGVEVESRSIHVYSCTFQPAIDVIWQQARVGFQNQCCHGSGMGSRGGGAPEIGKSVRVIAAIASEEGSIGVVRGHYLRFPSAASLVELAHARALREEFVRPDQIAPVYLRVPDAEAKWAPAVGGAP